MEVTSFASAGRARLLVRGRIAALFSSLFFVAGGVASFLGGQMTAPFYLLGSVLMLMSAAKGLRQKGEVSNKPSPSTRPPVWVWLVPTLALSIGFWLGFASGV